MNVRQRRRRVEKAFLDGAMMLLERGLLFGEGGDLGVWDQKNESERTRKQRVEKIVKLVVQRVNGESGANCGCG